MRRLGCLSLLLVLVFGVSAAVAASDSDDLSVREKLGELRLYALSGVVKKALGAPTRKGKIALQGADGAFVQTWEYAAQGLTFVMTADSRKAAQKVAAIDAKAPCTLRTTRGIGIGSTAAEVARAYGAEKNVDESTEEQFVAGSIYGGVLFGMKDGRVQTIFIGAAAE